MKFQATHYIHIIGWMITNLKLSGNELLCYAIIYGYSMDGETMMTGGIEYMTGALGVSRPTVISLLKKLVEKGLIERIENVTDCKRIYYRVKELNFDIEGVGKETLPTSVKNLNQPLVKKLNPAPINIKDKGIKVNKKVNHISKDISQKSGKSEKELIFDEGMKKAYPRVMKMPKPLTYDQYNKLLERYPNDTIRETLEAMENYRKLDTYNSSYRTLNKWLSRN